MVGLGEHQMASTLGILKRNSPFAKIGQLHAPEIASAPPNIRVFLAASTGGKESRLTGWAVVTSRDISGRSLHIVRDGQS